MRKNDASSEDGTAISRADAVATCCRQLVAQQQQEGQGERQRYSRVLFHTEANNSFTQVEVGDAASKLEMPLTPTHGTNFSAAWLAVEKLVEATDAGVAVHVVFLSDGRPGELEQKLPAIGDERDTARCNKLTMPSAPAVVRRMAEKTGTRLTIYAVAIGDEESDWLERIVKIAKVSGANASFTSVGDMNLARSQAASSAQQVEPLLGGAARATPSSSSLMMPPPMPRPRTTSLADTFGQIASSLTSSMTAQGAKPRVERTDCYEHVHAYRDNDEATLWKGHRLVLDEEGDGHSWAPLESKVKVRKQPFAHGGQRNAFHLFYVDDALVDTLPEGARCDLTGRLMSDPVIVEGGRTCERSTAEQMKLRFMGPNLAARTVCHALRASRSRITDHFVAKESRYKDDWHERLRSHKLSMRTALSAQELVAQFNERTPPSWPLISVLPAEIHRLAPASIKAPNPSRDYRSLRGAVSRRAV